MIDDLSQLLVFNNVKLSGNWHRLNTAIPESDGELLVSESDRHEGADGERQHDHQGDRDVPRLEHQLWKSVLVPWFKYQETTVRS